MCKKMSSSSSASGITASERRTAAATAGPTVSVEPPDSPSPPPAVLTEHDNDVVGVPPTSASSSAAEDDGGLRERIRTLEEKLKRTSKFLHEIQELSPAVEEEPAAGFGAAATGGEEGGGRERQVFVRRILQVSAELQDARDVIHALCRPPTLSPRQYHLLTSEVDPDGAFLDPGLDPSVRFFGVDWQQVFGRCFSLTLNTRIFKAQLLGEADGGVDLVLLSSILRDLARVESDVTSHGEAVLHGRLSKSQQRLIQAEQNRMASLTATSGAASSRMPKSRSFRDTSGQRKHQHQQRQLSRYKKNRTTDFNKLSASPSASAASSPHVANASAASALDSDESTALANEWEEVMKAPKRKSSFIANISLIFKNAR